MMEDKNVLQNNETNSGEDYVVEVENFKKDFPIKSSFLRLVIGNVKAVDGISFKIKRGTTMGLVGESGCGKSTTGRTMLRLQGAPEKGSKVLFSGVDIFKLSRADLRKMRPNVQIIFQNPENALDPRIRIKNSILEAIRNYRIVPAGSPEEKELYNLL